MGKKNKEKSVAVNETATPEMESAPMQNTKVEENKPAPKKPKMSKLRKYLIVTGSVSIGLALITLILDNGNVNGTLEIVMCVIMALAFIATEVLAILTYKREPTKKAFPLTCIIICSILLGIALILGIVLLFSIF